MFMGLESAADEMRAVATQSNKADTSFMMQDGTGPRDDCSRRSVGVRMPREPAGRRKKVKRPERPRHICPLDRPHASHPSRLARHGIASIQEFDEGMELNLVGYTPFDLLAQSFGQSIQHVQVSRISDGDCEKPLGLGNRQRLMGARQIARNTSQQIRGKPNRRQIHKVGPEQNRLSSGFFHGEKLFNNWNRLNRGAS